MTVLRDPSRRDFLAASAISLIGLALGSRDEEQMESDLLYVGTYTERTQSEGIYLCLLYTSPSPRDRQKSRMPSSA